MNQEQETEPLVEGTIIENPSYDPSDEIAARAPEQANEANSVSAFYEQKLVSRTNCYLSGDALPFLRALFFCTLGYTGRQVYRRYVTVEPDDRVTASAASSVLRLGNFSNRCDLPWEYACGSYASQSLSPRSVFSDVQDRVDVELVEVILALPSTSMPRMFYEKCTTAKNGSYTFKRPELTWWWDRGLEAGGLAFGRTRSNTTRKTVPWGAN